MKPQSPKFLPQVEKAIAQAARLKIEPERKPLLDTLSKYIQEKLEQGESVHLNFICTHNSRRSQLSQIWARTMAAYHHVSVECYSGGTEATAFNERAVESIKRSGFRVEAQGSGNPVYSVFYSEEAEPILAFSKVFDDPTNQAPPFAAVMTCSHADANCPFIPGAERRIPLQYDDPKEFDGTPQEAEKYDERSMQIASEMFYVFSQA